MLTICQLITSRPGGIMMHSAGVTEHSASTDLNPASPLPGSHGSTAHTGLETDSVGGWGRGHPGRTSAHRPEPRKESEAALGSALGSRWCVHEGEGGSCPHCQGVRF